MTKKLTKKKLFLFSIITIVLVLLVLEAIFRIVFAVQYSGYHTSVYIQGNTLQASDSLLVFKNRPFYLDYYKRFQFNEEGMRVKAGDVYMPKKGPNDYWVFLFGGSAMEGAGSNKDGEWLDITGVEDHTPDHTIAHYLEEYLQKEMPGKKVRVFNAANSGYSILQSMRRYQELSAKYQMDYVISLDGENEPLQLKENETVDAFIRHRWDSSALFKFPLSVIVPMTSHSAFLYKMKQEIFHARHAARMKENAEKNYPAKQRWLESKMVPLNYNYDSMSYAVAPFVTTLYEFDSLLIKKNIRHTLYVQPHLTLRDSLMMSPREHALLKYYAAHYNDARQNAFKVQMYNFALLHYPFDVTVKYLDVYHSKTEVFVDYCHFTEGANRIIAQLMSIEILKNRN